MTKADGGLRKALHTGLKPYGDFQAIETGLVSGGVPDTNFCIRGVEGWIESKRTAAWAVKVRPAQVGWAERRIRNGGRVFCAVRRLVPGKADELWLLHGCAMRSLIEGAGIRDLSTSVLGIWVSGPALWAWPEIAKILATHDFKKS